MGGTPGTQLLAVICHFDSASGIAWRAQGRKRVYGRPNKQLMKAIREVTASAAASA